jgi:colicin import membrane protein
MMAVDSKQGTTSAAPATPGPAATLAGIPAVSASGAFKRKRPSSLMAQSAQLPSVESSLDEFIAKANETLVDPSSFNSEQKVREEDEKRKEADALRWKATEQQMREAQAREQSLRRQLDGLQGKLAEAEARAAVAGSGGSQDGIIADLKLRLTMADEKIRTSEEKVRLTEAKLGRLEQDLAAAKSAAAAAPPVRDSLVGIGDDAAEERVRIAELKATKAIAAAKAAAAGLTVSPADIAAIESGLVVSSMDTGGKKTSWGMVVAAAVVAGAAMFAVGYVLKKDKPAHTAAAQPAAQQPAAPQAAAPTPTPAQPVVTPIEDEAKAEANAAVDEPPEDVPAAPSKAELAAAAKAEKAAAAEAAAQAKADKAAAAKATAAEAAAKKAAAAKKTTATAAPKKTPKSSGGLADPFGDSPAPKKAEKKKAGGIVDPF